MRKAAELAPDAGPVRLNLATAIIQSGDWNAAEAELRQMSADFPDDPKPLRELYLMTAAEWEIRRREDREAIEKAQVNTRGPNGS